MRYAVAEHKFTLYTFSHYELSNIIMISKGEEKEMYEVVVVAPGKFVCSCPGFHYRSYCWHTTYLQYAKLRKLDEPWTVWKEEAMKMRMEQRRTRDEKGAE